jgi:hypothetical protein
MDNLHQSITGEDSGMTLTPQGLRKRTPEEQFTVDNLKKTYQQSLGAIEQAKAIPRVQTELIRQGYLPADMQGNQQTQLQPSGELPQPGSIPPIAQANVPASQTSPQQKTITVGGKTFIQPQGFISPQQKIQNSEQQRMENESMTRLASVRGDSVLKELETQRNAAVQAKSVIVQAKAEGREPNLAEYTDVLGQLWRARTGIAPTKEVMHDLQMATAQGKLGKVYTLVSGKPAPASSKAVISALEDFVDNTGTTVDLMHEQQLAPHLMKPKDLEQDRWDNIAKTNRGLSYEDFNKNYVPVRDKRTGKVTIMHSSKAKELVGGK